MWNFCNNYEIIPVCSFANRNPPSFFAKFLIIFWNNCKKNLAKKKSGWIPVSSFANRNPPRFFAKFLILFWNYCKKLPKNLDGFQLALLLTKIHPDFLQNFEKYYGIYELWFYGIFMTLGKNKQITLHLATKGLELAMAMEWWRRWTLTVEELKSLEKLTLDDHDPWVWP